MRIGTNVKTFRHLRQQIPDAYIHQRRARFERVRHTRDIDFGQNVVGQVRRGIEILCTLHHAQIARFSPSLFKGLDRKSGLSAMVARPESRAHARIAILNELLPRFNRRPREHLATLPRHPGQPRHV